MTVQQQRMNISELIVGEHPGIQRLRSTIERIAPTTLPVLIQGPTGSGKELVARALHVHSNRPGSLVAFNVCAITESMFEDAMFGHVRGAFTGAAMDAPGYLLEAHCGTAFLDEIGALPLGSQVKLLRALETREFRPVGARRDRYSDFRIIAATNEPLATLVRAGRFRPDLAHRLGGLVLDVPPLSERRSDIPLLVTHLVNRATAGRAEWEVSEGALAMLMDHDWTGNVRELSFVVDRVLILSSTPRVTRAAVAEAIGVSRTAARESDSFERRRLMTLLIEYGWDTLAVAAELSVNRATVYRRMKRLSIVMPPDVRADLEEKSPGVAPVCTDVRLPLPSTDAPRRV